MGGLEALGTLEGMAQEAEPPPARPGAEGPSCPLALPTFVFSRKTTGFVSPACCAGAE